MFVIEVLRIQAMQSHGVCSAIYGTVHYKDPLKYA